MSSIVIQEANLRGSLQTNVNLVGVVQRSVDLVGTMQTTINLVGVAYLPEIVYSDGSDRTYILVDDFGHEVTAVVSDAHIILNATPNDLRLGKTAATAEGVIVGEKEIPD